MHFMTVKKSRKRSGFVIYLYLKTTFTVVKRDAELYTRYVKRVLIGNRKCTKGAPILSKMVY